MKEQQEKETISDAEAVILVEAYKNKEIISGQDDLGDVVVCYIKNGLCKVKFNNGETKIYQNDNFK